MKHYEKNLSIWGSQKTLQNKQHKVPKWAKSTQELELKCNDTLDQISNWMKEHGPKLAQEKSESVLKTKKRKFDYPKLELEGHSIQFENSIRYLRI